ncbi:MAG: glycine cleavage system protein H [Desulfobacterales bacterium]|nr:MAG: glycine cleavage system protein H [Desulfobacterales bacterium]
MDSSRLANQAAQDRHPCIWMQAAVVQRKYCRNDYDCTACRFDQALRRVALQNKKLRAEGRYPAGPQGKIVFWKDKLRELPTWKRPCIHHLKRRIEFRTCTHGYHCGDCEFDQYFSDQYTVHAVVRPVSVLDIKGFKIPQGFYLHRGHTWVKIEEGSTVRVGIDDFALRLLGPLDRVEAPLMGKEVQKDGKNVVLHRGAHRAQLLAPVHGVVTDVNPRLRETARLANQDPYGEGWVMRLHSNSLRQDLKKLMIGDQAGEFLDQEIERLYAVIEEEAGPLAADGGFLGDDIYGNLPGIGWQKLTRLFLHA